MVTATTEMPDGERLARVETRVEHLERQVASVSDDIRELRSPRWVETFCGLRGS